MYLLTFARIVFKLPCAREPRSHSRCRAHHGIAEVMAKGRAIWQIANQGGAWGGASTNGTPTSVGLTGQLQRHADIR